MSDPKQIETILYLFLTSSSSIFNSTRNKQNRNIIEDAITRQVHVYWEGWQNSKLVQKLTYKTCKWGVGIRNINVHRQQDTALPCCHTYTAQRETLKLFTAPNKCAHHVRLRAKFVTYVGRIQVEWKLNWLPCDSNKLTHVIRLTP